MLSGDFARGIEKSFVWVRHSREEAESFADLHGLGAALGAELIKEAAGMGLDRVFADEEAVGDFAVAQSGGDEGKDFEFAGGDAQLGDASLVDGEWGGGDFLDDDFGDDFFVDDWLLPGEGLAQPNAERGKQGGNECAVDFQGMLDDEETVFREF